MAIKDLSGEVFGYLFVMHFSYVHKNQAFFKCKCLKCGTEREIRGASLNAGSTKSCGCLQKETIGNLRRTHGATGKRAYESWKAMIKRCRANRPCDFKYKDRPVCERWQTFENFYADMGDCPTGLTLERKNNKLGYFKDNCAWVDKKTQARNRNDNRIIEYKGERRCLIEWAELKGLRPTTLKARLDRGWTLDEALNRPLDTSKQHFRN